MIHYLKTKRQQQHKVHFGVRLIHGEDITAELRIQSGLELQQFSFQLEAFFNHQLSSSISGFTFRTSGSPELQLGYEVLVSRMFVNKLSEEKYIQYRKK